MKKSNKHLFTTASILLMSLSLVSCGYSEVTYDEFHNQVLNAEANPYTTAIVNGYITMNEIAFDYTSSSKFDNLEFTHVSGNYWTYKTDTAENGLAAMFLSKAANTLSKPYGDDGYTYTYYFGDGFRYSESYTDDDGSQTTTMEYDRYGNIIKLKAVSTGSPKCDTVDADITFKYSK